jgi:hypothetical protein
VEKRPQTAGESADLDCILTFFAYQSSVEYPSEVRYEPVFDFGEIDGSSKQSRQRRHPAASDPAGDDQAEVVEIGRDVQRETVTGDPTGDSNAYRCEFVLPDPHARQTLLAVGHDPEISGRSDQYLFQIANVPMDVAAVGIQIQDWIPDDLAGTMISDVATSAGFVELNMPGIEFVGTHQQMSPPAITPRSQCQHTGVLDEQQHVVHASELPIGDEIALQRESIGITRHSKTANFETSAHET